VTGLPEHQRNIGALNDIDLIALPNVSINQGKEAFLGCVETPAFPTLTQIPQDLSTPQALENGRR
jgi:hypothetical protein